MGYRDCFSEKVPEAFSVFSTGNASGKAELITDGGSASGISEGRRGKSYCTEVKLQPEKRGVRICERDSSADTKICEERGEGGAPGAEAEIPLQP